MAGGAALQNVAAEDAQAREPLVIRIGRIVRAIACETDRIGRKIDLDQIGNKDGGDIRSPLGDRQLLAAADQKVDQRRELRIQGIFTEKNSIDDRAGAAVEV